MTRTIGVVTTSRADFGHLTPVLWKIEQEPGLALRLFISGSHLEAAFGNTVDAIEAEGFPVAQKIPSGLSDDTAAGIGRAMAKTLEGFSRALEETPCDLFLVFGDRFEMHAAATAAVPFGLPIAHLHGGEITRGAMDDRFRSSLTKLAHFHFAATPASRARIIQMGEQPETVFHTGAPGLDALLSAEIAGRAEIERSLGLDMARPPVIFTYHPETSGGGTERDGVSAALAALDTFDGTVICTGTNADPGNRHIRQAVDDFAAARPNRIVVESLGTRLYAGLMAIAACMVGNSSSGIIEAPSFRLPVVNIGDRQAGRERAGNVIDCPAEAGAIASALDRALSAEFRETRCDGRNPYGDGKASERIVDLLGSLPLQGGGAKTFYDIPMGDHA